MMARIELFAVDSTPERCCQGPVHASIDIAAPSQYCPVLARLRRFDSVIRSSIAAGEVPDVVTSRIQTEPESQSLRDRRTGPRARMRSMGRGRG